MFLIELSAYVQVLFRSLQIGSPVKNKHFHSRQLASYLVYVSEGVVRAYTVNLCLVTIKYKNPSFTNINVPQKYVFDFKE